MEITKTGTRFGKNSTIVKSLLKELQDCKSKNEELIQKNLELQQYINNLENKVNCYEAKK